MSASYAYDESGHSNFLLLAFLLLILVPWTISSLWQLCFHRAVKPPCVGWNAKDEQVKMTKQKVAPITRSHLVLALGWALVAYVTYRASLVKASSASYDPFAILGLNPGSDEKSIRRHFKRLSLKFHPDKLKLKVNETLEEVNEHFVNLTKAYKALTDETIRQNYEKFGHPDGSQTAERGIALPKWIVETRNHGYVVGIYGLVFGLLLPYAVAKWWNTSKKYTKAYVLKGSASRYFLYLTKQTTFGEAVEVLCSSLEFGALETRHIRAFESSKSYKQLEDQVTQALFEATGEKLEGKLYNNSNEEFVKRTAVLVYAHLFRIPISDIRILKAKHDVINYARHLTQAMCSITTGRRWLSTYLVIIKLEQHLVQAMHPATSSPLAQLPHVSIKTADKLAKSTEEIVSPEQYASLSEEKKDSLFPELKGRDDIKKQVQCISEHWPKLELVSSEFKVIGEKKVTPDSTIHLIMKIRMKNQVSSSVTVQEEESAHDPRMESEQDLDEEESEMDELLRSKKYGASGEEPSPVAHAPHVTKDKKPIYHWLVGDHKANTLFLPPLSFTDVGYTKTRVIRQSFEGPSSAGLYTVQVHIRSDSYVGTDLQASMQLLVEEEEEAVEDTGAQDDISNSDGPMNTEKEDDESDLSDEESSDGDSSSDSDSD